MDMTEPLDHHKIAMKGTNQKKPRCIALQGVVGESVSCEIYALRSSVCRNFKMSWEQGEAHDLCDKARIAWGLPPLEPPGNSEPQPAHAA